MVFQNSRPVNPMRTILMISAFLLIAAGLFLSVYSFSSSGDSGHFYEAYIYSNSTLEDVYIVGPGVQNNESSGYQEYSSPEGWSLANVNSSRGKMLSLETSTFQASRREIGEANFSEASARFNSSISGQKHDNFLFNPRENIEEVECPDLKGKCYRFDTFVYLSYDTEDNTVVEIEFLNAGYNNPALGFRTSYYIEEVSLNATGPQEGWRIVEGEIRTTN